MILIDPYSSFGTQEVNSEMNVEEYDISKNVPIQAHEVIKPWGMSLRDNGREDLDKRIKEHRAENAYFPLLLPKFCY